ncbi:MAG TPA: LuxR C-terminal-related transcriptional regulator [Nocardioides sp.]|nr:LuxR C-terminal-related transcriptional regulator [Nocardioides sp.]
MLVESTNTTASRQLPSGSDLVRAGRITEALQALDASDPRPEALPTVRHLAALTECHLARGDLTRAMAAGERVRAFAPTAGVPGALAAYTMGEIASAQGEAELAFVRYTEANERLGDEDRDDPNEVPWRAGAALALTRLHRQREADRLAREHLGLARQSGTPYTLAHALRTAATTNADGARLRLLREAQVVLKNVEACRLSAQVDTDLAVLLTLQGDPAGATEAVMLLRRAEAYAGREDLFPLQTRIRGILERVGEVPRRILSETLATLTVTEQTTARLAASGLTNREIAAELAVTVKAVEWHLSNVYRKLKIRGRPGLSETLGQPV